MKKLFANKYFLLILLTVVAVFNLILFLLVNQFNQELLQLPSFWVLYGFVMFFFIIIGGLRLINFNQKHNQDNTLMIIVVPTCLIAVILGIVLFFFVEHILTTIIIVIYVLLIGLALIGIILTFLHQSQLKKFQPKEIEVISMSGLKDYLYQLMNLPHCNSVISERLLILIEKANLVVKNPNLEAVKRIEKRIFEYASFLKKDIDNNSVNNFLFNAERIEKLLEKRGNY